MKKQWFWIFPLIAALIFGALVFWPGEEPVSISDEAFFMARVLEVSDERIMEEDGEPRIFQRVNVSITSGNETGKELTIDHGSSLPIYDEQKVAAGDSVLVSKSYGGPMGVNYYIYDQNRLPAVSWILAIFLSLAVALGGKKGFFSIFGLILSLGVLIKFIIPQILEGKNPLLISVLGAGMILFVSLYLAHGFNKKTTLALISTLITLSVSALLAVLFVAWTKLTGVGTEEASYLQIGMSTLNAQGLLLGGIIIGALGVLDDITTTQVATVYEIFHANPKVTSRSLYQRGITVGKEHIASLVNTLVLAYAGASFPLLMLFALDQQIPVWVNLNNEFVVEEVIRTLSGSMGLLLAVPIATFLAVFSLMRKRKNEENPNRD